MIVVVVVVVVVVAVVVSADAMLRIDPGPGGPGRARPRRYSRALPSGQPALAKLPTIYDLVLLLSTKAVGRGPHPDRVRGGGDDRAGRRARRAQAVVGRAAADFPIDHQAEAQYELLQFSGPTPVLESLSHSLGIADGVLRHRVIKVTPGTPPAPDSPPPLVGAARPEPPDRWPAGGETDEAARLSHHAAGSRPFVTRTRRECNVSVHFPLSAPGAAWTAPRLDRARESHAKEPSSMNINRVILTGNLTRDPDHRQTPGGLSICKLGIAVNTRRKGQDGNWEEKPNFFRVTVFGRQADSCANYLRKGRPVAIDGRLEWSQYEVEDRSANRSISSPIPCSSWAARMTAPAMETGVATRAARAPPTATSRSMPATSSARP